MMDIATCRFTFAISLWILCSWKTCVIAFSSLSSSSAHILPWTSKAYHPTLRKWQRASWKIHSRSSQGNEESDQTNNNYNGDNEQEDRSLDDKGDDLSWISEAMNSDTETSSKTRSADLNSNETNKGNASPAILQSGISGFAIDSQLGFVCILSPDSKQGEEYEEEDNVSIHCEKFTFVTVSPLDTDSLSSPEALCLIQLAGGLDLGAAVFPPETLASLVRNELVLRCDDEEDDDDEKEDEENEDDVAVDTVQPIENVRRKTVEVIPDVQDLRSKVTLLGVTALPNEEYNDKKKHANDRSGKGPDFEDDATQQQRTPYQSQSININDPKRKQGIQMNSPKILAAVQNLPGLTKITLDQVIQAMEIHADSDGQLNQREAFSELLDTLRTGKGGYGTSRKRWDEQRIKFKLTVSVNDGDGLTLLDVDKVPPFQAIALALRYKVPVTVSSGCLQEIEAQQDEKVHGCQSVKDMFPAFKPMQELMQDARVMDGLISSMFFKESAPDDDIRD